MNMFTNLSSLRLLNCSSNHPIFPTVPAISGLRANIHRFFVCECSSIGAYLSLDLDCRVSPQSWSCFRGTKKTATAQHWRLKSCSSRGVAINVGEAMYVKEINNSISHAHAHALQRCVGRASCSALPLWTEWMRSQPIHAWYVVLWTFMHTSTRLTASWWWLGMQSFNQLVKSENYQPSVWWQHAGISFVIFSVSVKH